MEGHGEPGAYKDVILFLATAGIVVPLFRRWRMSPILGFLGAGVLLGPYGLGRMASQLPVLQAFTIDNPDDLGQLAELGVVFLLFMIGLELSWERLRSLRRLVFGMGALQVVVCIAALSAAAAAFGQRPAAALAIAAALALSSTAVVMPTLTERKRQHSPAGRAAFSVLLFQDLAVAPILVTLALIGRNSGEAFSPRALLAFAPAVIGLAGLVIVGRLVLRPMLRSVARAKSEELFVAACLLVVIGSGLLSALAGFSMAIGAFIAGLLLAETEFRHEVEVVIEPFKGLLLGLFFLSIGIGLNLPLLFDRPLTVIGAAAALIVLKTVLIFGLAAALRFRLRSAFETALLLAAAGEFAFVILAQAMRAGLVEPLVGQSLLVSATLTMALIPLLARLGVGVGGSTRAAGLAVEPAVKPGEGPVLIVGYGRVGKLVGEMLRRHGIPWVTAERDQRIVERARRANEAAFFGDAARPEFLVRCGLAQARALVVTMDDPDGAESVVEAARGLRPDLTVIARARDARHAKRLYALGAADAVPETVEASLQLSEALLVEIGLPMGQVIASIHERRDAFRAELNRPESLGGRRARGRLRRG